MGFAISTSTYLYQHPSGYIFRLRIPNDLRSLIGKSEYRYSLRTGALRIARHRARLLASHIHQVFLGIHSGTTLFTKESINQHIKHHVDSWETMSSAFSGNSQRYLPGILHDAALKTSPSLPPVSFTVAPKPHQASAIQQPQKDHLETPFSELQKGYEAEMVKGGDWTEKTHSEIQTIFALFIRVMGDIPLERIDRKMVSQYKGILAQLPPNLNMLPQYKGKISLR